MRSIKIKLPRLVLAFWLVFAAIFGGLAEGAERPLDVYLFWAEGCPHCANEIDFIKPTTGDCKLLVAWHIDQGHLDNQVLDGLNVALACYSPGNMIDGNWKAALYVDEQADDSQVDALVQIFSGRQGGHPAILMSFVGKC
jgi:hypothetical protein